MYKKITVEPLPAEEVHLWLTPFSHTNDTALAAKYQCLLSPEELARQQRFHFEQDSHRYLVTRALVRTVLSHYFPVAPSDWGFGLTPYGRPTIVTPALLAEGFTFNLSHSSELVVCAVRLKGALGVDTEHLKHDVPLSVAKSYFAISEVREMADLSPAQQPERFLRLWTLKESYVKARGMGLSLPLDQFGFCFPSPGRIAAFFHQGDTPSQWAFWQLRFDSDNLIALCTENDCPLTLVIRQVVPLQTPHFLEIHDILSSA